jgi:hypothetical protein
MQASLRLARCVRENKKEITDSSAKRRKRNDHVFEKPEHPV